MVTQYFTFGCGQTFANHYIAITAVDSNTCREVMFDTFANKWSMQYDTTEGFDKYGVRLLASIIVGVDGSRTTTFAVDLVRALV